MPVYAFKYYILISFLGHGNEKLSLGLSSVTEPTEDVGGGGSPRQPGCAYADIVIHKMQMPSSISNDSMQCREGLCSDVFLIHFQITVIICQLLLMHRFHRENDLITSEGNNRPVRDRAPFRKIMTMRSSRS